MYYFADSFHITQQITLLVQDDKIYVAIVLKIKTKNTELIS